MLALFVYKYTQLSCVVYVMYLANTLHVSYQIENTSPCNTTPMQAMQYIESIEQLHV